MAPSLSHPVNDTARLCEWFSLIDDWSLTRFWLMIWSLQVTSEAFQLDWPIASIKQVRLLLMWRLGRAMWVFARGGLVGLDSLWSSYSHCTRKITASVATLIKCALTLKGVFWVATQKSAKCNFELWKPEFMPVPTCRGNCKLALSIVWPLWNTGRQPVNHILVSWVYWWATVSCAGYLSIFWVLRS